MKKLKQIACSKYFKYFASALLVVAIYNSWFLSLGVQTAGDWPYFSDITSDTLRRFYFSMWLSDNQFGRVLIDAGQAPTYAIYGWLSYYFNTGYGFNERLIHLWPSVILALFSSYTLIKYLFKDKYAAILGMIVYSANTYYLALLTGGLTLAVAYAIVPLIILFYLKAVNTRKVIDVILCALIFSVCGAYEPRIALIIIAILGILAIVHYFYIFRGDEPNDIKSTIKMFMIYASPIVIFGLLNIYWVIGLSKAGGADSTVIASNLFGNEFFNISEALTLFHPFWTGKAIQPFFIHNIPIYFWFIPVVAFGGLAFNKKDYRLLFFAVVGAIGILLTKQSGEPFSSLYEWLFIHLPGFNAFREASKFYLLIALSYSVLIAAFFLFIKKRYGQRYIAIGAFIFIAMLFLPNLIPVVNNTVGPTFRTRSIPSEYTELNNFLDQDDFSRTLWVPQKSRWSLSSDKHPIVSASALLKTLDGDLEDTYKDNKNATQSDEIIAMLKQNFMPTVLSNAAIKYVIVPQRDVQNDDNFYRSYNDDPAVFARSLESVGYLKKLNLNIKGFIVYETIKPKKPYFSSTDKIYAVTGADEITGAYSLQQSITDPDEFNFILGDNNKSFTTEIKDLFNGFVSEELKKGKLRATRQDEQKNTTLYYDQAYADVSYVATKDNIAFQTRKLPDPSNKATPLRASTVQNIPLEPTKNYLMEIGDDVSDIHTQQKILNLGSPRNDANIYRVDSANIVPRPTIKGSLWSTKVDNCTPYGISPPDIKLHSSKDNILDKPVLSLMSKNHSACSGPATIPVVSGDYLLDFKYRGFDAQYAGYQLTYDNDRSKSITVDIPLLYNDWQNHKEIITVPKSARNVTIKLIGRPSSQVRSNAIVSYTDLQLFKVYRTAVAAVATGIIKKTDASAKGVSGALYTANLYKNLIPNGSFTSGAWQKQVNDCNAYDNNPALKMAVVNDGIFDGKNSLELGAKRHIACTNTPLVKVEGGKTYLLRFDYQSSDLTNAGYSISVNGSGSTNFREEIPIVDSKPHTYTRTITLPSDSDILSLALFAYSKEGGSSYQTVLYDNVLLQKVPDITNRFYSVADASAELGNPKNIQYKRVGNTYKEISIESAEKPFILLMSEQYHTGWQLTLNNKLTDSSVKSNLPWVNQAIVPSSNHLEVNGFQNAWYVDPGKLCTEHATACVSNNDGTYNIALAAKFEPQKWFTFGLSVSLTTLAICVSTVLYLLYRPKLLNKRKLTVYKKKH